MSASAIQQMAFHINKALAKVQYINGQQMGDTERIELAAMAAISHLKKALREAGVEAVKPGWMRRQEQGDARGRDASRPRSRSRSSSGSRTRSRRS